MDLQAILDASDSSDDGYGGDGASSSLPYRFASSESLPYSSLDVEQILREDYDDDDDYDLDNDTLPSSTVGSRVLSPEYQNKNGNGIESASSSSMPVISSHTTEDWAVLQAILREGDDDSDDDDDTQDPSMDPLTAMRQALDRKSVV